MKRQPPRWTPQLWQASYRRQTMWVEQEYTKAPRWGWHIAGHGGIVGDSDGRAATREAAQECARRVVDIALGGRAKS